MKSLLAFGILAIATMTFSHAGTIGNLKNPTQFQAPNQLLAAPKGCGEQGEPKPCVPGEEYDSDCDGIEGTAGIDYPVFPYETTQLAFEFKCSEQKYPGFYADPVYGCQIFHICADGQHWTSICNNGTIFHQGLRTCVFYKNFDCQTAVSLYEVNVDSFKPPKCPNVPLEGEVEEDVTVSLEIKSPVCITIDGEVAKNVQAVPVDPTAV